MFRLIIISFLFALAQGGKLSPLKPLYDLEQSLDYFIDFVKTYDKVYEHGEAANRFQIFSDNLDKINKFNEEHGDHIFSVNIFTDLTYEEFGKTHFGFIAVNATLDEAPDYNLGHIETPDAFDWRDKKNVLAAIKHQDCGDCWAFSAAATMESQHAIKKERLIELSEHQLVDCDTKSLGCKGGFPDFAFKYAASVGGMMSLKDYPNPNNTNLGKENENSCQFNKEKIVVKVTGGKRFAQSEDKMLDLLVNYGPFSIGIYASPQFLRASGSKVLDPTDCSRKLSNHAVNVVGYGNDNGTPYWIIRNSWGTNWGDKGYLKLIRGKAVCNLSTYIATAEVE